MSSSPFVCTCAENEEYCGHVSLSYCIPCAASDGHCECVCECDACLYTDTPCEYAPEGLCVFCSIRNEWAQPCCEAASPCDDCITKARAVPHIRIPPSVGGVSTPTPFVEEAPASSWWGVAGAAPEAQKVRTVREALEAAANTIWHGDWVAAVKKGIAEAVS